ncbi:MAG: endolytic transglycosylase MltG, partial [Deltaproteobacteria bacterium]
MMRRLGLLALLAIAALGAGAGWLDSQINRSYRGPASEKVFVDIPRGTSRWGIAGILRRNDIIPSRLAFVLFSEWHFRNRLQAGEYLFDRPLNSREVFWKIARGQVFVHVVTIPEGWTMYDIAADLDRLNICSREEFLVAARDTSLVSDLAPQATSLEG